VLAASVSEAIEAAYSVLSVLVVVLALDGYLLRGVERAMEGVGVGDSVAWSIGSRRGVGMGVTSVEGVISTSSASRYHFRRRV
jgi:hypothetical protein